MFGRRQSVPPQASATFAPAKSGPRSTGEKMKPVPVVNVRPVRKPRGGLLSLLSGLLTFGVVIAGVAVFGIVALESEVDKPGPLQADKIVLIPKNTGTSEIAELLSREGVVANQTLFELYAYLNRRKGNLKAGEFQFRAESSIAETTDTLINGKAILHAVTIPEGLTSEQTVARIRDNDVLTGSINETPREGTMMPDTYRFDRGTSRQQLVNLMQAASRDSLKKVWERRAPDLAIRTPQELVILASIVEKETGRGDERPRVASVFLNRLQRRMKLQSDPTIVYGIVGGKGTLGRGITRAEIDRATPYNTYAIEGLPPGPIANPGRAALEAVANPLKTRDLYFVADGTGGHAFAETYDQHLRNVARWRQIEKNRDVAGSGPPQVDRVDPPPAPDNRTQYESGAPRESYAGARSNGRAFDAVEGTAQDPLRVQNWDLTTPKTVPNFGPPIPAAPARTARRTAKPAPVRSEASLPPGFEPQTR